MKTYKLTLTNADGELLNTWVIGRREDDDGTLDLVVPLKGFGAQGLIDGINREVEIR